MIILASKSQARRDILRRAGIDFEAVASGVDEDAAKRALVSEGLSPRDIADALAELKAVRTSLRFPGLVFGADQTLDLDGQLFDKATSIEVLKSQLNLLRGRSHTLHSALVAAEAGVPVWRAVKSAKMTVRNLSDDWISDYVSRFGNDVLNSVGGYHFEGYGIQMFEKFEGDHFTILGLPLIDLLGFLRPRGLISS